MKTDTGHSFNDIGCSMIQRPRIDLRCSFRWFNLAVLLTSVVLGSLSLASRPMIAELETKLRFHRAEALSLSESAADLEEQARLNQTANPRMVRSNLSCAQYLHAAALEHETMQERSEVLLRELKTMGPFWIFGHTERARRSASIEAPPVDYFKTLHDPQNKYKTR